MTSGAEDRATWPSAGLTITRDELLRLIEDAGYPDTLDLRGAVFHNDESSDDFIANAIDLSPDAVAPLVDSYRRNNAGRDPPWLDRDGSVDLSGARLNSAILRRARLRGVDLSDAELRDALLEKAQLNHAYLARADLRGAWLAGAELQQAGLSDAWLERASLREAQLQGADATRANLQHADLSGASFEGANLAGSNLCAAHVHGTQLQDAILEFTQLQQLDMYPVESLAGAHWHGAFLDHTRMRREKLGHTIGDEQWAHSRPTEEGWHRELRPRLYRRANEAYLLLKNNFNQIGRYEDASWAYVKEQQMEKMAYYWEWRSRGWRLWRAWGSLSRWLRNWAYELATGYGERPWMPAVWAIVVVVAFMFIYAGAGSISPDFAGDPAQAHGSHSFVDALTHSIGAFATIGFNTLEPLGWGARLLTAVESAFGIGLFALFIFTLGNRMSRG
jgi:uncharacterized protein YjbI with pentapeptide repeats